MDYPIGTKDQVVAAVATRWPEHRALHFSKPSEPFDDEQALIEFAVHVALSMAQQLADGKLLPDPGGYGAEPAKPTEVVVLPRLAELDEHIAAGDLNGVVDWIRQHATTKAQVEVAIDRFDAEIERH